MTELREKCVGNRRLIASVTDPQWFVASRPEILAAGVSEAAIRRAVASGRLFVVHKHVFSTVAPELLPIEGRLKAAILAGGRDASLCGPSAAAWLRLIPSLPAFIHVAVRHRRRPIEGIVFHRLHLRPSEWGDFNDLTVTSPQRTALDVAATESLRTVKHVLAELEYRFDIEADELLPSLRKGHPGSARLRDAIRQHTPQLADTREALEEAFAHFLIERSFKLPEFNHPLGRSTVDAVYLEEKVVIELDGVRGHKAGRRILRDHRRDLHRRRDGFLPLRYHFAQIRFEPDLVESDLERAGIPRI